jgi:hypothetical protein
VISLSALIKFQVFVFVVEKVELMSLIIQLPGLHYLPHIHETGRQPLQTDH